MITLPDKYYKHLLEFSESYFSAASHALVCKALNEAAEKLDGLVRYDGRPMICHSIEMALIVMKEIGLGRNSVISTLLHDVARLEMISTEEAGARYGNDCTTILKGLCNISDVDPKISEQQKENFKELIVSYSTDPRVILIKLADRLEVMRSLDMFPQEKQRKKSWESLNLYAQIAHKLGLYSIKSELEDISLMYLESDDYIHIRRRLAENEKERAQFIASFIAPIDEKLKAQGFDYHIKSRSKSIYSIWRKMKKNNLSIDEIYDLFAIRIIIDCPQEKEKALCWNVYSIVTDFYTPNPERMRDWISIPKSNGYESLHTTVVTKEGRWVEIQIRSERMDEIAERGVAAHWRYKGVKGGGMGSDEWLARLRNIIENSDNSQTSLAEKFDTKLSSNEVFVFTPNGDLRKLPEGATILDFAFDIHTGLGCSCTGGKVNGRIVPIKEVLHNGDIVEIITSKNQKPKADWLSIAITGKARNKIKAYLRELQAKAAILGREELERKIKNWKMPFALDDAVTVLCKYYKFKTGTELYYNIVNQKIVFPDIKDVLNRELNKEEQEFVAPIKKRAATPKEDNNDDALVIDRSLRNIDYKLAKCCNPIYGDDIFGFTTISAGITIHRNDCPNAARLKERYPYRVLTARWHDEGRRGSFLASIKIQAEDMVGLVNQITEVISGAMKINIRSMNFNSLDGITTGTINIEVTGTQIVDAIIHNLLKIKGMQKVYRG